MTLITTLGATDADSDVDLDAFTAYCPWPGCNQRYASIAVLFALTVRGTGAARFSSERPPRLFL